MVSKEHEAELRIPNRFILIYSVIGVAGLLFSAIQISRLVEDPSWKILLDLYSLPAILYLSIPGIGLIAHWINNTKTIDNSILHGFLPGIILGLFGLGLLNAHFYFRVVGDIGLQNIPVFAFLTVFIF